MDIPDLVRQSLGDEEIQAGVSLGDEDAVCLTPTRTLVYRGDGLISDEQVEEYSHDIEQLVVSEGRRKTKFTMQYIDGTQSFTVPVNRGERVLELFLEGVLRLDGVIEPRESLAGVYRFSELTLIIAEGRLVKHIGSQAWTDDYEVYPYEDVTGLDFEQASVATSIALSVNGRPQRVKVPNDKAAVVRQTLEGALFDYYDVGTLEEFNRAVGIDDPAGSDGEMTAGDDDFAFGDDFDPLVSEDEDLTESVDAGDQLATGDSGTGGADSEPDRTATPQGGPNASAGRPTETSAGEGDAGATERTPQSREQTTTDTEEPVDPTPTEQSTGATSGVGPAEPDGTTRGSTAMDQQSTTPDGDSTDTGASTSTQQSANDGASAGSAPVSREEYEAMAERLNELTEAVDRQNELLKRQHRALKQLVKQQSE